MVMSCHEVCCRLQLRAAVAWHVFCAEVVHSACPSPLSRAVVAVSGDEQTDRVLSAPPPATRQQQAIFARASDSVANAPMTMAATAT